jgi:hypothetical protein
VSRGGAGIAGAVAVRGGVAFPYLSGSVSDGLKFPTAFTSQAPYTLFHVAR